MRVCTVAFSAHSNLLYDDNKYANRTTICTSLKCRFIKIINPLCLYCSISFMNSLVVTQHNLSLSPFRPCNQKKADSVSCSRQPSYEFWILFTIFFFKKLLFDFFGRLTVRFSIENFQNQIKKSSNFGERNGDFRIQNWLLECRAQDNGFDQVVKCQDFPLVPIHHCYFIGYTPGTVKDLISLAKILRTGKMLLGALKTTILSLNWFWGKQFLVLDKNWTKEYLPN